MKVIAECSVNWDSYSDAANMIVECEKIGIKYIKFQLFRSDQVPHKVQKNVLIETQANNLISMGLNYGVTVFFTPFYPMAVDICEKIGVKYYKIRHADRNRYDLYTSIKNLNKPIFVSTGLYRDTIWMGHRKVLYLFCVPKYPATEEDYYSMTPYLFDGVSDHTPGIKILKRARDMGFKWFEKHVCLTTDCYEAKWSVPIKDLEGLV